LRPKVLRSCPYDFAPLRSIRTTQECNCHGSSTERVGLSIPEPRPRAWRRRGPPNNFRRASPHTLASAASRGPRAAALGAALALCRRHDPVALCPDERRLVAHSTAHTAAHSSPEPAANQPRGGPQRRRLETLSLLEPDHQRRRAQYHRSARLRLQFWPA